MALRRQVPSQLRDEYTEQNKFDGDFLTPATNKSYERSQSVKRRTSTTGERWRGSSPSSVKD